MENTEIRDAVFNFIYNEALDDATRRTQAAVIKQRIKGLESVRTIVRKYAESVADDKEPCFYEYERKIEDEIYGTRKENKLFTFGNIQKLINMTMEYLYIEYYDTDIYRNFACCHVPLDSIMRDLIYKEYGTKGIERECAWSKVNRDSLDRKHSLDNYIKFQVNSSDYGDSRITKPSKYEEKDLIRTKGVLNSSILIDDIDIYRLREFQLKEYSLQKRMAA